MINWLWPVTRPVLFSMDAEKAHHLTVASVACMPGLAAFVARTTMGSPPPSLKFKAFGLEFGGPIGLAAGLDKNAEALRFWPSLGFGFVEVGTVTAHPQTGNPTPRLFRLVAENALINRMGFNNEGSEAMAERLTALREADQWPDVPVGVNIGKSKVTPLEDAPKDYVTSVKRLVSVADYFTVNVSSPNTPGLRDLQGEEALSSLLGPVVEAAGDVPVLLKVAPDLADDGIAVAVEMALKAGVQGMIATNTTIRRDLLDHDPKEGGGMSGEPLWPFAHQKIKTTLAASGGRLPVIGVGGVSTAEQVTELLNDGCVAVQLYSALIFQGPGLIHRLNQQLARGAV